MDTDFDWRCVVGAAEVDLATYLNDWMFGLPTSQTFLYGRVRDHDGAAWNPMRRIRSGDGGHERFLLQTDLEANDMRVHSGGRDSSSSLQARRWTDGAALCLASASDARGEPFEVRAGTKTFVWDEGEAMRLRGTAIPPSLHWHLPDRRGGMYYRSQIYEVEGDLLGREVRGFVPVDQLWMDGSIYDDDIFVGDKAEVAWFTWATRYTNGSFEGGHFLLGHRQLGFAVVYDESGRVWSSTDVDGRVALDASGTWPERIELTAGGQSWEFLPDPKGRMVDLMPIPNPQVEGRWRRAGDDREPSHWFAWGEVAPGHGTAPVR